jgi:hypothetical protein
MKKAFLRFARSASLDVRAVLRGLRAVVVEEKLFVARRLEEWAALEARATFS